METGNILQSRRVKIQHLYQSYCSGQTTMPACNLLRFLHIEQMEVTATDRTVKALIDKFEIDETARENSSMSFEGFFRYMESKECCVFNQLHKKVYQNMDQPLTSYFISSSHNTYIIGDQLVGETHLDGYICALRKGCRCVEIDCWDGPDLEPVVFHGHTLTNKLLFKDIITTVSQHAFEVSAYPVILSLENHCSLEQQEVLAQHLISILGDKLLKEPLAHLTSGELPSPNDLKYKILVKNKKVRPHSQTEEGTGTETQDIEDEDDEEEKDQPTSSFFSSIKWIFGKKRKKVVVAEVLSDLVIYTCSVKFISFDYSREHQKYCENTSMDENKARKLAKDSSMEFIQHNQRFLSRIYPSGARLSSSNYNPQEFWNIGSQLVALNFQSLGSHMDLHDGRFQDNGGCGYTLKPPVLMSSQEHFDPRSRNHSPELTYLLLKIISGSDLPTSRSIKAVDRFVRVDVHGTQCDFCTKSTHGVKHNSLSPWWDFDINFKICVPGLCLIRFCVRDETGPFSSEFVGQYTLPLTSLKKGYRWVPLRDRDGSSLDPASLFVYVCY
ncbi:1-phosphatidylinositol 4,5-bisphosphate phosphodiesterase zeta-1-like [Thalassophryne amazonica]|uniref:1-phosphatidylinositol 4,5-bisphosphate phosphodiesterase zeta-1-like n=1 Tax=Thalassophryne amazonica TaxID=390379 RepID=UPI001471E0CB|nr:1-phosphatidylinositol 4,5-bisphosphate phosphodiesterase zeta-1-like [Thalassophryne amazonica]